METNQNKKVEIRPLTHKDLHQMYKVSWLTFQRWLKRHEERIGKKMGQFYSTKQVEIIFEIFGRPEKDDDDE